MMEHFCSWFCDIYMYVHMPTCIGIIVCAYNTYSPLNVTIMKRAQNLICSPHY